MERYLRTGEKRIIGIGREVIGLKKDGTVFPLHLSVPSFEVDRTVYFTGITHDLTERTRHEDALKRAHKMEAVGQLTGIRLLRKPYRQAELAAAIEEVMHSR